MGRKKSECGLFSSWEKTGNFDLIELTMGKHGLKSDSKTFEHSTVSHREPGEILIRRGDVMEVMLSDC
jgi:hypothetical protein